MIELAELYEAWWNFFFAPKPVHTVAVFRILLSLILLIDTIFLWLDAKVLLGPKGLLQYEQFYKRNRLVAFSLFLYLPPTMRSVYLVLTLHVIFLLMMLVGFLAPLCIVLVFITLTSIINRNPGLGNGGDVVARLMLFLLMFTPCSHALSMDEWLFYQPSTPDGQHLFQAPWALRLMQIQLSAIYLKSVYWKLKGKTYLRGTAFYYSMRNNKYSRWQVPEFFVLGWPGKIMTWSILASEVFLGTGLWIQELRYPAIISGFALHLFIELTLNVHLFGWYMMASLLLFVDPYAMMSFLERFII